jgi:hypothetical protein
MIHRRSIYASDSDIHEALFAETLLNDERRCYDEGATRALMMEES